MGEKSHMTHDKKMITHVSNFQPNKSYFIFFFLMKKMWLILSILLFFLLIWKRSVTHEILKILKHTVEYIFRFFAQNHVLYTTRKERHTLKFEEKGKFKRKNSTVF